MNASWMMTLLENRPKKKQVGQPCSVVYSVSVPLAVLGHVRTFV